MDHRVEDMVFTRACLAGDAAALRRLDRLCQTAVRAVPAARRLARPRDELGRDLLVRLVVAHAHRFPRLTTYQGRGDLTVWIRRVATSMAVDELRRERRVRLLRSGALGLGHAESESAAVDAWLDHRYTSRLASALHRALVALRSIDKGFLVERYLLGLSNLEIARRRGLSPSNVTRRFQRLHRWLYQRVSGSLTTRSDLTTSEIWALARACDFDGIRLRAALATGWCPQPHGVGEQTAC